MYSPITKWWSPNQEMKKMNKKDLFLENFGYFLEHFFTFQILLAETKK